MSNNFLFPAAGLAFIFGVLFASVSSGYVWIICAIFLILRIANFLIKRQEVNPQTRRRSFLVLVFVGLVFFSLGCFRANYYLSKNTSNLNYYYDQKILMTGFISSDPELGVLNQKFYFRPVKIIFFNSDDEFLAPNNKSINLETVNISVTAALLPEYEYGQILKIQAYLSSPCLEQRGNICLKKANSDGFITHPYISILGQNNSWHFKIYRCLFQIRRAARKIINSGLSEPEAGLANALILGYKRTLNSDDLNDFSRAGLSHLVAISGTHITLISAILIKTLLFVGFSRRRAFPLAVIILLVYTVLTGFQSSAVRSLVMGILSLAAIRFGRSYNIFRALVFAAALMIYFNPRILLEDLGFQLSFLAMLALVFIYPRFKDCLDGAGANLKLKLSGLKEGLLKTFFRKFINFIVAILDILSITVAAQLITWPISAVNFGQVSLVAPLANLGAAWAFDLLMIVLLLAIFLGALFPFAWLWFLPSYFILKYVFLVGRFFASWSGASKVMVMGWNWAAPYCLLLLFWISRFGLKNKNKLF